MNVFSSPSLILTSSIRFVGNSFCEKKKMKTTDATVCMTKAAVYCLGNISLMRLMILKSESTSQYNST